MIKQLRIAGIESEQHAEINEAAEELKRAIADQKRASERVAKAKHVLVSRMIEAKQKSYGFKTVDGYIGLLLDVPAPTVKLTFQEDEAS